MLIIFLRIFEIIPNIKGRYTLQQPLHNHPYHIETKLSPFADDVFICIFLNDNCMNLAYIFNGVPEVRFNNIPALVRIMAWRRPGDKPKPEPKMVSLLTRKCVNRPRYDKITFSTLLMFQNILQSKIIIFANNKSTVFSCKNYKIHISCS